MLDMWYGNDVSEVNGIDVYFNDLSCEYSGNCYINGKAVGDYSVSDSLEVEKLFPHLKICWN